MSDELEYVWAASQDLEAYEEFLRDAYGADSVQATRGRARWLFWDNPFGLHVALCRHRNKVVAACGHLPLPVRLGGGEYLAAFGVDMMVSPAWRRHGIGRRLLEMRRGRFDLGLSSGQSPSMAALYDHTGARDLGAFRSLRFRQSPPGRQPLRPWLRDLGAWFLPRLRRRQEGLRRPFRDAMEAAAVLGDSTAMTCEPRHEQSIAAWFRWRYAGPLYDDYRCWRIALADEPPGVLVTRQEPDHELIVDLVAPRSRLARLLAAAAWTSAASLVTGLVAGDTLVTGLARHHLLIRRESNHLLATASLAGNIDPRDMAFLAGISDADLMRPPPQRVPLTIDASAERAGD